MLDSSENYDGKVIDILLNGSLETNHPDSLLGYLRSRSKEG